MKVRYTLWILIVALLPRLSAVGVGYQAEKPASGHIYWLKCFDAPARVAFSADARYFFVVLDPLADLRLPEKPSPSAQSIQLLDEKGQILWKQLLAEGNGSWWRTPVGRVEVGNVLFSVDGTRIIYDYWYGVGALTMPHERIKYRGGVRCLRLNGDTLWEKTGEGFSEGGPVCSPLGSVAQVARDKILLTQLGFESVIQFAFLDWNGKVTVPLPNMKPVDAIGLLQDGSGVVLRRATRVLCLDVTGRTRWELVGGFEKLRQAGGYLLIQTPHAFWQWWSEAPAELKRRARSQSWQERGVYGVAVANTQGQIVWAKLTYGLDPPHELSPVFQNVLYINDQIGSNDQQVAILHEQGASRTLFALEQPATGRGRLVLSRKTELPERRSWSESAVLSPDGRMVLLARYQREVGKDSIEHWKNMTLDIYDQQGRSLKRIDLPFDFGPDDYGGPPRFYWADRSQKIIVVTSRCLCVVDLRL